MLVNDHWIDWDHHIPQALPYFSIHATTDQKSASVISRRELTLPSDLKLAVCQINRQPQKWKLGERLSNIHSAVGT